MKPYGPRYRRVMGALQGTGQFKSIPGCRLPGVATPELPLEEVPQREHGPVFPATCTGLPQ